MNKFSNTLLAFIVEVGLFLSICILLASQFTSVVYFTLGLDHAKQNNKVIIIFLAIFACYSIIFSDALRIMMNVIARYLKTKWELDIDINYTIPVFFHFAATAIMCSWKGLTLSTGAPIFVIIFMSSAIYIVEKHYKTDPNDYIEYITATLFILSIIPFLILPHVWEIYLAFLFHVFSFFVLICLFFLKKKLQKCCLIDAKKET